MELLDVTKHKMEKAVEKLDENLKTIRTGVANASLLEHVHFEYYGSETPINQVASIKVVEGRQLMIKPYDRSTLKDIERAIATSDTGLVPQSDGEVIRLNVPALTEERRKQLSKEADKMGEEAKIAVRNVRREANDAIKKDKELTEDDAKRMQEKVQRLTDEFAKKIEKEVSEKEKEIMKV
ncbi:ribosome recycling factor [Longicatena caecimuris]|uniref:ribosome recycling factor n=1 Tax=Longicatena caecimuris TaxID=1796635 RepID=UPI0022E15E4C|nr:ribosome recycling factor [Longicatena caecimuris]